MSKVALYHCRAIEQIPRKLEAIVDSLGQEKISAVFRNRKVLLKPNLCIDFPPERGATTHPALVDAVIGMARDFGARVIVADGPIVGVKGRVFEKTGVLEVCKKHDVELINLNRVPGRKVVLEDALALKEAVIARTRFEVDAVVNLALFKSNLIYWLSGALKNMKGFLVGTEKHKAHYLGVPRSVADLNRMIKQDLVIMDGFIGMMGDGPAMGRPAHARLMIGGTDPVAVDAVAAELMGFPVKKIPMIRRAKEAGAGSTDYEVLGDPIDSFALDFDRPKIATVGPMGYGLDFAIRKFFPQLKKRSKIIVDLDKCTLCGRCREMCPFDAVRLYKKSVEIDREKCDLCLCCLEVCGSEALQFKGLMARSDVFFR